MRIAITEPDALLADLISFRLELLGHEVVTWDTTAVMLTEIGDRQPDLLIVDMHQSDVPGCEAIQGARKKFPNSELPIMAISVDTDLTLVEQAYKAGADDYLITPFDPATLQTKTDNLLMRKHDIARRK